MNSINLIAALSISAVAISATANAQTSQLPDRVTFISADGRTTLVGYVFKSQGGSRSALGPAVVMMHGRAGAYSSLANGNYDAATLSKRHQEWGHLWAAQGYIAILIDGFGPRDIRRASGALATINGPKNSTK